MNWGVRLSWPSAATGGEKEKKLVGTARGSEERKGLRRVLTRTQALGQSVSGGAGVWRQEVSEHPSQSSFVHSGKLWPSSEEWIGCKETQRSCGFWGSFRRVVSMHWEMGLTWLKATCRRGGSWGTDERWDHQPSKARQEAAELSYLCKIDNWK